jgi:hypothetical protein
MVIEDVEGDLLVPPDAARSLTRVRSLEAEGRVALVEGRPTAGRERARA